MTLTAVDVGHFLIVFAIGVCLVALAAAFRYGGRSMYFGAAAAVVSVVIAVAIAARSAPGENVVLQTAWQPITGGRVQLPWIAAGGLCGLLAGLALAGSKIRGRWMLYYAAFGALSLLTLKDELSKYLENPQATGGRGIGIQRKMAPGFQLEELANLTLAPTSLTVDDRNRILIAGYSGIALQNGIVIRMEVNPDSREWEVKTVAASLSRPHGLAMLDGDLYVSRAGQFSRAVEGKIVQENTGAVTRLRDLDGDGVYDDYHDVIANLPGAQFPDGLHQNNGIAFDAQKRLYVGVGAPSDNAPFSHPLAGTIIRTQADGSEQKVFARGLRNPYDLAFGPDDELFCTDNDPNETNAGDRLNHIREGGYYGFPYTQREGVEVSGMVPPLCRLSSAQGLLYVPKGSWPSPYDDCLYVASYADGNINRVRLTRKDDTYSAEVEFFAHVPNVIDLTFDGQGVMYAASHHDRKLYRIVVQP